MRIVTGAVAGLLMTVSAQAQAAKVDLALVLLIDGSSSVRSGAYELQVEGHARAVADPRFLEAIRRGDLGAVAVTVVQFSGPWHIEQSVPWTVVDDIEGAVALGDAIRGMPPLDVPSATALGHALEFGARLFEDGGYADVRRVLDLSANGVDNVSGNPYRTRDRLVSDGITINGIVLLDELPNLPRYFADNVVGGPGAFVLSVAEPEDYARVLLTKLVTEVAGLTP